MFTSPEKVHVASAWLSFSSSRVFQGVCRDGESRTTVQVKTYKVLHMDKKVHMILQIEESKQIGLAAFCLDSNTRGHGMENDANIKGVERQSENNQLRF